MISANKGVHKVVVFMVMLLLAVELGLSLFMAIGDQPFDITVFKGVVALAIFDGFAVVLFGIGTCFCSSKKTVFGLAASAFSLLSTLTLGVATAVFDDQGWLFDITLVVMFCIKTVVLFTLPK